MKREREERIPTTKEVVQGAFRDMHNYANMAGTLPSADYEYHCAFSGFTRSVRSQSDSLLKIMEACFQLLPQRRRPTLYPRDAEMTKGETETPLATSSESGNMTEAKRVMVLEAVDSMLENVDGFLDELRGNKLQGVDQVAVSFGSEFAPPANRFGSSSSGIVNAATGVVHVSRVIRPQLLFKKPVDNSHARFVPQYVDENGVNHVGISGEHPFKERFLAFTPSQEQICPSPETPYPPLEASPLHFVDTLEDLRKMVEVLLLVKEIAVDLEHHDFYSFLGFTCLMQISTRQEDYIVDCLKLREELREALPPVFLNSEILKVFHGAKEDIRWLQKDFGLYVLNFFDTGVALKALHMPYSLSFAVDHFCHVKLEKKYQTADWRIRPLPAEMVHYARQDTHYLLYVYDRLKAMLLNAESRASAGNLLLNVYSTSKSLSLEVYEKPIFDPEHSFLRSLGRSFGGLTKAQLRVARHVYNWRDEAAREVDDSPFAVLHQSSLLSIATKLPQSVKEFLQCASPVSVVLRKNVGALVEAIQKIVSEEGEASAGVAVDEGDESATKKRHGSVLWSENAMGVYRPMTGSLPSISLPSMCHPCFFPEDVGAKGVNLDSFSHEDAHEKEKFLVPQSLLASSEPSLWLQEMREVARRIQKRPYFQVPVPGSDVARILSVKLNPLKEAAGAPSQRGTLNDVDKDGQASVSPSDSDAEGGFEKLESNSKEELRSTTEMKEHLKLPEDAFSLRQTLGTGAKNRRREKKANKNKGEH